MVNLSESTCLIVGLFGTLVYLFICLLSLSCWCYAINRYTKRVFLLLCLYAICELPWYLNLAIMREFSNKISYSFSMVAAIFLFGMYSTVCFAWGDVLRAKNLEVLFESKRREKMRSTLVFLNILFSIFTFISIGFCVTSPTLDFFIESKYYELFASVDAVKNVLVGFFIAFFGNDLRFRIKQYCHSSAISQGTGVMAMVFVENTNNLIRVSQKLVFLVILSIVSFTIKLANVCMWRRYSSPSEFEPPESIRHLEVVWWVLFELIPYAIPASAFIIAMGWPSRHIGKSKISYPEESKFRSSELNEMHISTDSVYVNDQVSSACGDNDENESNLSFVGEEALTVHIVNDFTIALSQEGEMDCFNTLSRLSALSGSLVDIELERNSFRLNPAEKNDKQRTNSSDMKKQETTSDSNNSSSASILLSFLGRG